MSVPPIDMGSDPKCDVIMIGQCKFTDDAIRSLEGEPVRLHRFTYEKNIGYSRYKAIVDREYELPYMAIVDSDDLVPKGIWKKCFDILDDNPEYVSVYTFEQEIDTNGNRGRIHNDRKPFNIEQYFTMPLPIHKLNVVRTAAFITASYQMQFYNNMELTIFVLYTLYFGKPYLLPEIGYYWRMWNRDKQLHLLGQDGNMIRTRRVQKLETMADLVKSGGIYGIFPL